jgi:hypothetical protein
VKLLQKTCETPNTGTFPFVENESSAVAASEFRCNKRFSSALEKRVVFMGFARFPLPGELTEFI